MLGALRLAAGAGTSGRSSRCCSTGRTGGSRHPTPRGRACAAATALSRGARLQAVEVLSRAGALDDAAARVQTGAERCEGPAHVASFAPLLVQVEVARGPRDRLLRSPVAAPPRTAATARRRAPSRLPPTARTAPRAALLGRQDPRRLVSSGLSARSGSWWETTRPRLVSTTSGVGSTDRSPRARSSASPCRCSSVDTAGAARIDATTDGRWRTLRVATYNIHRCRGLDGAPAPPHRRRHSQHRAPTSSRCRRSSAPARARRARRGTRRAARHGLGHGADAPPAQTRSSATSCSAACRSSTTRSTTSRGRRASRAAASASTSPSATTRCTCTTCTSAPRSSSGATRRAA